MFLTFVPGTFTVSGLSWHRRRLGEGRPWKWDLLGQELRHKRHPRKHNPDGEMDGWMNREGEPESSSRSVFLKVLFLGFFFFLTEGSDSRRFACNCPVSERSDHKWIAFGPGLDASKRRSGSI